MIQSASLLISGVAAAMMGMMMAEPFPVRTKEMVDYCESVSGVQIFRELHGVKEFADTRSTRGCGGACSQYLMVDGFKFVEVRYEPALGHKTSKRYLLDALVEGAGWHRFVRQKAGHPGCTVYDAYQEMLYAAGAVKDPESNYTKFCIETIKIDGPAASIRTRVRSEEPRQVRDANRRRAKIYTRYEEIVDLNAPPGKEVLARSTSVYARLNSGGEGVPLCKKGALFSVSDLIVQTLHP